MEKRLFIFNSLCYYTDPNYMYENNYKFFQSEYKLLTNTESEISNKLRFECINLNSFK